MTWVLFLLLDFYRWEYLNIKRWYAAVAKALQSRPTLWYPIDGSPPGSLVPGSLQARTLEWGAISFSNECKWKEKVKSLSCARLVATARTADYQAPPSMGFSRQEYWSGVPLPYYSAKYLWLQPNWLELQAMAAGIVCYLCLCQPLFYCWLFKSSWGGSSAGLCVFAITCQSIWVFPLP